MTLSWTFMYTKLPESSGCAKGSSAEFQFMIRKYIVVSSCKEIDDDSEFECCEASAKFIASCSLWSISSLTFTSFPLVSNELASRIYTDIEPSSSTYCWKARTLAILETRCGNIDLKIDLVKVFWLGGNLKIRIQARSVSKGIRILGTDALLPEPSREGEHK